MEDLIYSLIEPMPKLEVYSEAYGACMAVHGEQKYSSFDFYIETRGGDAERTVHCARHDAESVFWVILDFLIHALLLDTNIKEKDPKQFANFRSSFFSSTIQAEMSDPRLSLFQTLDSRTEKILHPGLAPFAPLLVSLSRIVHTEYYWLKDTPNQFHLHEAIQRVLLDFIFKMRTQDVLLNKKGRRKAPKPDNNTRNPRMRC